MLSPWSSTQLYPNGCQGFSIHDFFSFLCKVQPLRVRDAVFLWFVGSQVLTEVVTKSYFYCSMFKVNRRLGGTCSLHLQARRTAHERNQLYVLLVSFFTLVSFLAYSSTLKMGTTCFSETWVHFQRTKRRYNPGNRILPLISSLGLWSQTVSPNSTSFFRSRSDFRARFP
jgi:hypothetical protein